MAFTDLPELLTRTEAANLLRMSTKTLLKLTRSGEIPCTVVAGKRLYLRDDIAEIIYKNYRR